MEVIEKKISDVIEKFTGEEKTSIDVQALREDLKSLQHASEKAKESFKRSKKERLNSEHQLCQLEKQVIALNTRLGKEALESSRLTKRVEESDTKLTERLDQLRKLDDEKTELVVKYNSVSNEKKQLEDEKATLLEVFEKKSKEIERLDGEWKAMSQKLSEATKANYEAQAKLDELQSGDITREFKLKRLEQEKDLLSGQNDHLTTQLNGKTEELATLKRNKTTEVLDLQNLADSQKNQIEHLTKTCENYKTKLEEHEAKVESLMEKLKRARDELSSTESHMTQELNAKNKLVDLYKESSEDGQKKINEMTVALLELQKMLKETDDEKSTVEAKLTLAEKEQKENIDELEQKIKALSSELDNANDLLDVARKKTPSLSQEAVEGMSPTAAAASALMKKGMTLTQIYSEYVEVSDALEAEKDENTRLKQYLDQILQEIEEKAPALQRQRGDYEMALKTIENLTSKFDAAMTECERFQSEREDAVRKSDFTKRENERMNTLCIDLSQQVRVLLKEVEEARGGVVSTEYKLPELISSDKVSSSSQVISEHLVSFKNIEELQEQNQKLLAVVRDLSEEREKQEKECSVEKMSELSQKLDIAFEEVKEMKDEREKQNEIIQTLVKQRDMYKVLYNAEDRPEVSSTSFLQQSTVSSAEAEAELEKAKAHLAKITEDYEKYRHEFKEKENSLQEKLEKLEEEVAQLRCENQQNKGKIEFLEEKNDSLQRTNEALTRESEALTVKGRGLETAVSKLQKEAAFYKQELEAANEKLINLEVSLKSSATEKRLMKGTEQRLMQENKTLIEQQRSQNVLLTNLQTIQNSLERQEFETRKALGKQVEELQLEMKSVRRKLDAEESNKKTSISSLNTQVGKLNIELEAEKKLRRENEEKLTEMTKEYETAKDKCTELSEQLAASEARLKAIVEQDESSATENIEILKEQYAEKEKSLQSKLTESESRIKALSSQAQNANKHLEQYKQIATSCEEALKDANEKYATLQKESTTKSQSMQQRISELSRQLEATRVELASRKSKADRVEQELQNQFDSSRQTYSSLEKEYNAIKGTIEGYKQQCELAKAEAKKHVAIASEKQEKYERELVLHAKDVEELVKVKEQVHEYEKSINASDTQIRESQERMVVAETAMENMKVHHAEEIRKVREHSKQIAEQNTLLHKEIEKLSTQIVDAKSQKIDEITKLTEESGKPVDQSTEDLYEVIRFIRREKEIAETKFEALQSESLRYRQRCDHFEKELDETQSALELERKRTLGLMLSKEEHEELMEKVAHVAELNELNKELEKRKKTLENENGDFKKKVKQLEDQLGTLKDGKKLLEDEKGSWVAEKTALKNEKQRWMTRAQQLIEQNNKATHELEELKNLQKAKSQTDKVISALKEEISRLKAQKEAIGKETLKVKKDATEIQDKAALLTTLADTIKAEKEQLEKRTTVEIETLKKDVEEKTKDVTEKSKMIQKLKALARKYKSQCEELQKGKEPGTGDKEAEAGAPSTSASDNKKQLEQLEEENNNLKAQIENLKTQIKELDSVLKEAQKSLSELSSKSTESMQADDELRAKLVQVSEERDRLAKEIDTKMAALAEKDEKDEKNKRILRSAKEKISDLSAQRDKLANENKELKASINENEDKQQAAESELKEKDMRMTAIKSQYESNTDQLKADLAQLKSDNDKLNDRIKELEEQKRQADDKSNELTKAIADAEETIAKLKSQTSLKPMQDFPVAEPAAFAPLTATVRPTAATVTNQPQKSMSSRTASIRPLIPTVTPTAMVSPTVPPVQQSATNVVMPQQSSRPTATSTASVAPEQRIPEGQPAASRGQASVFKTPRMLATVQAQEGTSSAEAQATVAPMVATSGEEEERADEELTAEASQGDLSEQIQASEVIAVASGLINEIDAPIAVNEEQQDQIEQQASRDDVSQESDVAVSISLTPDSDFGLVEQGTSEPLQQSIDESAVHDSAHMKRRRSESSSSEMEESGQPEESPDEKRQRVEQETESQDDTDDVRQSEVISISDGEVDDEDDEEDEGEDIEDTEEQEDSDESGEGIEEDSDDDDEEDEEGEGFEYEAAEEGFDEDDDEMEGEGMEEEEEGETQDEADMEEQENVMEDVEEESADGEQQQQTSQGRLTPNAPVMNLREPNREMHRRQPSPAAFMLAAQDQSGRGRLVRRRNQLPSFSLPPGQGGSGPFDEADDCTVPSTPTLYEPKRLDGFAEAVSSSPQVRHPVFSFPGGSESGNRSQSVGLDTGVNDEGLRMDDTRVDLLAGEEPASVPLTPIGVVPSITVTPLEGLADDGRSSYQAIVTRESNVQGRNRESSTARVPQLSAEDNSQEQNVPQHIDLTADDEEDQDADQEVLSTDPQDDDDLFEDIAQQNEAIEEQSAQQEEDTAQAKDEAEESGLTPQEHEQESESKVEKDEEPNAETSQETSAVPSVVTRASSSRGRKSTGRRPRIRRTALPTRGQVAEEKPENIEQGR